MKLIIFFNGDPSVGVFPAEYEVECPFSIEDIDKDGLKLFKELIMSAYREFDCNYAMYDFEIEQMTKEYNKQFE